MRRKCMEVRIEGLTLTLSHFNKEKVNGRKNGKREDV